MQIKEKLPDEISVRKWLRPVILKKIIKDKGDPNEKNYFCNFNHDDDHCARYDWMRAGFKFANRYAAVGQKRHFFTYYGVKMLYDYNHSKVRFTKDDKAAGITNIPASISTGFIVATKDNVDLLIESQAEKQK